MSDIKLPPLPRPDAEFGTHSRKQIRAYTIAAIEADRNSRGGDQTKQKPPETRANTGLGGGDQRAAFEAAVIERMKESGFLEVEIRAECLVRSGDDYQDELINFGWRAYQSALESPEVKVLRAISDEYNELIRHLHKGGDALEFLSRRAATGAGK